MGLCFLGLFHQGELFEFQMAVKMTDLFLTALPTPRRLIRKFKRSGSGSLWKRNLIAHSHSNILAISREGNVPIKYHATACY